MFFSEINSKNSIYKFLIYKLSEISVFILFHSISDFFSIAAKVARYLFLT